MKKIIYVLGNPLVTKDKSAVYLLPNLKKYFPKYSFVHFDPTEDMYLEDKKLVFIDSVVGIKNVTKFNSLDYFLSSPRVSVHDFDLLVNLRLMQKLGRLKEILIIGIPTKRVSFRHLKEDIKKIIETSGI